MAFQTLSVDLVEYGERAVQHFRALGFVVRPEPRDIGFPSTPTLTCRRPPTLVVVHLISEVKRNATMIEAWCGYARAAGRDTRIALLIPETSWNAIEQGDRDRLGESGIGVFVAYADRIDEIAEPQDLGMNVALPELARMPIKHRQLMATAYDHFDHGRWREGFDEACRAVESQARRYLAAGIRAGRIRIIDDQGNDKTPTLNNVRKMTLGQLAHNFRQIRNQTLADTLIGKTLVSINKDRVGRAHGKRSVERRLRLNVGRHMHVIVAALNHLLP